MRMVAAIIPVGWLGLRVGATRRSVCVHQMNLVNCRNDFGRDDSTINIVVATITADCLPRPVRTTQSEIVKIYTIILVDFLLLISECYAMRLRPLICAFFYRKVTDAARPTRSYYYHYYYYRR